MTTLYCHVGIWEWEFMTVTVMKMLELSVSLVSLLHVHLHSTHVCRAVVSVRQRRGLMPPLTWHCKAHSLTV